MSIDTMKWVMEQEIFPSAAKFVLLCLCDHAGKKTDVAYPSIETLSRKTSQDRKTVISGLDKLCELGFLAEAGAFSSGIKHYRVIGFPDENNHYVYRVSDPKTGEFCIGARSFDGNVHSDKFIGGSRWAQEKGAENLSKEIIGVYTTRKEAELAEAYFIDANKKNDLLKNKGIPRESDVPKTPPVPKTVPVPKTGRGSTENGTGAVPKTGRGSTENGTGAVPKTGHRNINEPLDETLGETLDKDGKKNPSKFPLLSEVDKQVASDFIKQRNAKNLPLTETALKGIKREADKLGYTLEQALTTCCERGWAGFKADWVLREQAEAKAKTPISREQEKRESTERARARVFGVNPTEKDITHEATRL